MSDNRTDADKIKAILKKCKDDPVFFISNFIKVIHPQRGLVLFKLYPFQEQILKEFKTHRFNILRKFRQAGCTTLVAAFCLWLAMFHPPSKIIILSIGDDESKGVMERIKLMYDELPSWIQLPLSKGQNNEHTIGFQNKSSIKSKPSGRQSSRSFSGSLLVIDEAAFIENIRSIYTAAYPIISTGGSVIALSTVNGVGNWFHEKYTQAKRGENEFNAIDINWESHPEYKRQPGFEWLYEKMLTYPKPVNIDEWESVTRKNIDYKEWLQEFCGEFLGTGDTYIDGEILKQLKENCNPNYVIKYNNKMRVWRDPEPNRTYIMACDTALGRGRDYSAFHIFDVYTGEQIAEFYSNRTPINEFADICVKEARLYNNAYMLPENNTIGENLIHFLFEVHEYENILMSDDRDLGMQITQKNRENLLANMEDAIRSVRIKLNSERTIDELLTFIIDPDTSKIKADTNCHDDLIMSLALAVHGFNEIRLNPLIERRENTFNDKYKPTIEISKYNKNNSVILTTSTGKAEFEDLSWLLKN